MEGIGKINCYSGFHRYSGEVVYTINLANGTTPYCLMVNGQEFRSMMYQLNTPYIQVKEAWYRPNRTEFDKLNRDVQDHVLMGGLLHLPLKEAVERQMPNDDVSPNFIYEQMQEWCEQRYGRRLPPMNPSRK